MQSVARPRRPSRRRSSCTRATTRRAPLIPSGWPIAIAPPLTLTRSGSSPSSRMTASVCEANASLSSTRSIVVRRSTPGALEQLAHGRHRPDPHHVGIDARDRRAGERGRAARCRAPRARSSLAITSAAAPSLSPLALPAVTVPSVAERGLERARASRPSCRAADARRARARRRGDELVGERARARAAAAQRAAMRARTRPGPRARCPSARRRSRRSLPSTRVE